MAASTKMLDQEPSEIEMLLPFHAAGTLSARDARRRRGRARPAVSRARPSICGHPRGICRERSASTRASGRRRPERCSLFAAIRCRAGAASHRRLGFRLRLGYRVFSPGCRHAPGVVRARRACAAAAGRCDRRGADERQRSIIRDGFAEPQRAIVTGGTDHRDLGVSAAPSRALVRFAPEARIADITALLDKYRLDHRRRQGRHVPAAVQQGCYWQGRCCKPAEPAAA